MANVLMLQPFSGSYIYEMIRPAGCYRLLTQGSAGEEAPSVEIGVSAQALMECVKDDERTETALPMNVPETSAAVEDLTRQILNTDSTTGTLLSRNIVEGAVR